MSSMPVSWGENLIVACRVSRVAGKLSRVAGKSSQVQKIVAGPKNWIFIVSYFSKNTIDNNSFKVSG